MQIESHICFGSGCLCLCVHVIWLLNRL